MRTHVRTASMASLLAPRPPDGTMLVAAAAARAAALPARRRKGRYARRAPVARRLVRAARPPITRRSLLRVVDARPQRPLVWPERHEVHPVRRVQLVRAAAGPSAMP